MKYYSCEFKNLKPLYIELYENIKNSIINKELKPNEKLPSKRALASHLNISVNTVIKAYDLLIDEGYIKSKEKKGYFVDNISINIKSKKYEEIINKDLKDTRIFLYDFTTKELDSSIFPKLEFKKLYQEALNQENISKKESALGSISFRKTIKEYLREVKNIRVNTDNIIVASGTEILLERIIKITEAKTCYMENPSYRKFYNVFLNGNVGVSFGDIDENGLVLPKTNYDLLLTTPFNQFPTGKKMSLNRKHELVSSNNLKYIIEDSFDSEFKISPSLITSLYSMSDNVIYLESFSRILGSSIKVSFMILPDSLLNIYNKYYSSYSSAVSSIDQYVMNEFIKNKYISYINKLRTLLKKKRELILNTLDLSLFEIISKDNYLSIIVKPKNYVDEEIFKKYNLDIKYISSYEFLTTKESRYLIIGYSSIDMDKIKDGIKIINTIFK